MPPKTDIAAAAVSICTICLYLTFVVTLKYKQTSRRQLHRRPYWLVSRLALTEAEPRLASFLS
jgi:energy-converting hydrogenase Eha subunit C